MGDRGWMHLLDRASTVCARQNKVLFILFMLSCVARSFSHAIIMFACCPVLLVGHIT